MRRMASRQTATRPSEATISTEVRVTSGTKPESFHQKRQIDAGQRRMGVGERADGNQRAGAEEVPGGGDVVAGLVPVIGQAKQGEVAGDRAPQRPPERFSRRERARRGRSRLE